MNIPIICLASGFIIGIILYLIIGKVKHNSLISEIHSLELKKQEFQSAFVDLKKQIIDLETSYNNYKKDLDTLNFDYVQLQSRKDELNKSVQDLENYSNAYYSKNLELATEKLDVALTKAAKKYQKDEAEYQDEYLKTMRETAEEFATEYARQNAELKELSAKLKDLRAKTAAAVEAHKRDLEDKDKQNFYRLQLPKEDIIEIARLREVIPYLRDKEALNKVIWKVYYEKPYTDLIGRVVGSQHRTGIYRLTNITNGMCYVGQAVDIADRWKTHIKRGCGAESGGRNKLYPVMYEIGPENFTFEIIEDCDRSQLNEREDYWQDYFKAKEFGYSIK